MQRPEEEEDDEHVMRVPEALVVGTSGLLNGRQYHTHESNQHDVAGPSRTSSEIGNEPSVKPEFILDSNMAKVDPMRDCMNPREEDDRPGSCDVKGDVLVELDDSVKRCAAQKRNQGSANWEENEGDIYVKNESRRTRRHESEAKGIVGALERLLQSVVNAAKGKDEAMSQDKDENKPAARLATYTHNDPAIPMLQDFVPSWKADAKTYEPDLHSPIALIDHPAIKSLPSCQLLLSFLRHLAAQQHTRQGRPS